MPASAHLLERIEYVLDMPRPTLGWADTGMLLTEDDAFGYECLDNIQFALGKWAYPEGVYLWPTCPLVGYYAYNLCEQSEVSTGYVGFLAHETGAPFHVVPFSFVFCFVQDGTVPPIGVDYALRGFRRSPDNALGFGGFPGPLISSFAVGAAPWRVWVGFNTNDYSVCTGKFVITLNRFSPGGTFNAMRRPAALQKAIIGVQSTVDTPVVPNVLLQCVKMGSPSPDQVTTDDISEGSKRLEATILEKESTKGTTSGKLDATEFLYLAGSYGKIPVTNPLGAGVQEHIVNSDTLAEDVGLMFTCVYGDTNGHERVNDLRFDSISIASDGTTVNVGGSFIAKQMKDSINDALTFPVGANNVQTLTETGTPTGGNTTMDFNGAPFVLPYNSNAAGLQALLDALVTVGAGNSVVTGGVLPGSALIVTFGGALAGKNLPQFKLVANALTGGVAPTVTPTVTTKGGFAQFPKHPIARHEITAYYSDTLAGLDTVELAGTFIGNFQHACNLGGKFGWYWTESGTLSPTDVVENAGLTETLQLILKAGTELAYFRAKQLTKANVYIRLRYLSKSFNIAGTGTKERVYVDLCCQVDTITNYGGKGDNNRVYGADVMLKVVKDPNWGDQAWQIRGRNGKTDYTS